MRRHPRTILRTFAALVLLAGVALAAWLAPYAARVRHVQANPAAGFASGYYLYLPSSPRRDAAGEATLLVQPNNSGRTSDDFERKGIAEELGVPLLVPAFPRTASDWRVYTHALDRDSLTTRDPALARPDLQLIAMIDDARAKLAAEGLPVAPKVLLQGFSASAMFANRFTALHPERVRAVAAGSPGGWPIAPLTNFDREALPYPAGVADLQALTGKSFDADAFARVPQYLYMGDGDDNDSLDFEDGWDALVATRIKRVFGATPVARWPRAGVLYRRAGVNARFELVPGIGHDRKALQNRATAFLRGVLEQPAARAAR